tara:strand:+ start:344 stop:787 length:444 start_codon:yes stop_codon:yes gene_type:complete
MKIRSITAKETFIVRHPVLRPGKPLEECVFEFDNNPSSIHLGLEIEGSIISVLSALPIQCEDFPLLNGMRLRGIATLEEYQKKGFGTHLMNEIEKRLLKLKEFKLLWLNARINSSGFYQKLEYKTVGGYFNIPGIGLHQRYFKKLRS